MLYSSRKYRTLFFLFAAPFLLAGCASVKKPENTVEMGVALPFSGSRSEFAQSVKNGMTLAMEEINAGKSQEKKLEIIWADTKGDITEVPGILQGFVRRDIKVIHAGFTYDIAYDLDSFGLLKNSLVNYLCAYPPAAVHSPNGLRIFLNGAQECEMLASLVKVPKDETKKLMIMSVGDPLGKSCGDYLKFQTENTSLKTLSDTFKSGENSFDIFAEQINFQKIDYIMLYGYGDTSAPALESLVKSGYKGLFASNAGFYGNTAKAPEGIEAYEAATLFSLGKLQNKEHKNFVSKYEKKFGEKPHWTAAYGYDSVMLVWNSLKENAYDAPAARKALLGKTFEGAAGKIAIDKLGDTTSELELVKKQ